MLEQLVADGVTCIFGNPGTTEQGFLDLLYEYPGITYYLAPHEGVAVAMADAYARAARRPAFVQLHISVGLGNATGMLYNAYVGHSPLVVYVGQAPLAGLFQEPLLSADLVAMARPVTKWAAEITRASDVPQALRRAFKWSNRGRHCGDRRRCVALSAPTISSSSSAAPSSRATFPTAAGPSPRG